MKFVKSLLHLILFFIYLESIYVLEREQGAGGDEAHCFNENLQLRVAMLISYLNNGVSGIY